MRLVPVITVAVLLATPTPARAGDGDILVQREPGSSAKEVRKDAGVKLVDALDVDRMELVAPTHGDVTTALAALRADEDVVAADIDRPVQASTTPNDFYWTALWGLSNSNDTDIDAPEAWLRSVGAGVTVGVVDTGVNATHEDLLGQLAENAAEIPGNGLDDDHNGLVDDTRGWDFVSEDNDPQDGNGHGTHVSGTIAALSDNHTGLVGVAPEAKVLPVRALDDNGSGWMSDIAAGFAYAGDLGLRIVNASLGGGYSSVLENVVAAHPNTLYVVAAGNAGADDDNPSTASYPCALPEANVLCVGATDSNDARASFSNYGSATVDLSAPGVGILSASNSSSTSYKLMSGTSMATPHVAGAAALALAAAPRITTSQLKWALTSSVDVKNTLATASFTAGRLNADAAVAAITGDGPASVPTPEPTVVATPVATAVSIATPTPSPVATATPVAPVVATPTPAPPAPVFVAPVATPAPSPVISAVKVSKHGSKLKVSFALSSAANVRFTLTAKGKRVGLWTRHSLKGANAFTFAKKLKTGAYTMSVALNASAKSSAALRVR